MAGVRSFSDLDAWKLANALKLGVYALLQRPSVQRDHDFHDQIRDAAASAPRNIAEGFGRFQPRDFSQYLRIANGSLHETSNHLRDVSTAGISLPTRLLRSKPSPAVRRPRRRRCSATCAMPANPEPEPPNPRTTREPREPHEPREPEPAHPCTHAPTNPYSTRRRMKHFK
jgi:four helix bundle protein